MYLYPAPTTVRMVRSYQPEPARSRPISEAKQAWAGVVVWWGTTCEGPVSNLFVVWTRPSATLCCAPALPLAGSFAAAAACTRLFQPIYTYLHLSTPIYTHLHPSTPHLPPTYPHLTAPRNFASAQPRHLSSALLPHARARRPPHLTSKLASCSLSHQPHHRRSPQGT